MERFITRWRANEGGAERANYVLFLSELCTLLGLPQPDPAHATHERNDYVFERAVTFRDEGGKAGHGRIDLYRRGAFVLEAKQSREPGGKKAITLPIEQATLPGFAHPERRGSRSAQRGWDVLMRNAREQAEQYARALPTEHGWPPFILTCDVGHAIEIFADFSGQGKNYRQFPDRGGFRIYLDDLRDPAIRQRLCDIWQQPQSLDPSKHAAAVTRDIARRLASVSKLLENRGHQPETVAHFLMRCLFTMFAEEEKVRLLPPGCFTALLDGARGQPETFAPLVSELWAKMDTGGLSHVLRQRVRKFNGGLFADCQAIDLTREEIGELYQAALYDWTEVEPAIFGTLLEQALDRTERKRLGAHYTPRAYVERLVIATIIEPLQREWQTEVLGTVERERAADPRAAIKAVHDFHVRLAETQVLDPACGTGNFLYVALELMKRLEGDVLEVLSDLGGQDALAMENVSVHPRNFLGLELNPRAAAIAELVLWLGYLQWQLRSGGGIADPVLERLRNIVVTDAVLLHGAKRLRADGTTELPDPRRPDWPAADYIVGNPPFIGGKDIRGRLGDAYATALWKAHPKINKSADFVMYWWDRAAGLLTEPGTRLKRFGFVTTNSITQDFSRRTIERHLRGTPGVDLVMAVPDHPWTKASPDAAAVRIAMTVAQRATMEPTSKAIGRLHNVIAEEHLDTDAPALRFDTARGSINPDLTIGPDVTSARALRSNHWICSPGVKLHGAGFLLSEAEADYLGRGRRDGIDRHIRPYRNGKDITSRSRGALAIDLFGLEEADVRRRFPEIFQHLMATVKRERSSNNRESYRDNWWIFGEPRRELRHALATLPRYIATVETAKHRVFQFVDIGILPDNMLVCLASDDPVHLGILSSRASLEWTYATCGLIGVARFEQGHRYTKSLVFDPFPFPAATPEQRRIIGDLAEELDTTRKDVLAEHPDLTLTGLYNLRDKLLKGETFTIAEQDQRARGRIDIIAELHDRIDDAVADAYGWPRDLSDAAIVARLVALNADRHAEEQAGTVRWLRPDYQLPRAGVTMLPARVAEQIEAYLPSPIVATRPSFPRDAIGQTAAVLAELRGGSALASVDIARRYAQGRKIEPRVSATLAALVRLGHVADEGGRFILRRAA